MIRSVPSRYTASVRPVRPDGGAFSNTSATFGAQLLVPPPSSAGSLLSPVVWSLLKATMGLRVSEEEEMMGVDVHECGIDALTPSSSASNPAP